MLKPPTAYLTGYAEAHRAAPEVADNYIRHTRMGDPVLDSVLEEISSIAPADLHLFIKAGIEENEEKLKLAPEPLRDFFRDLEEPEWLDYEAFRPGIKMFPENVDFMLAAFVAGVLVEGFSTTIAKSFAMTGRVASTSRRLRQNNRQLMEIFFPRALEREGDGWRLSVRVRFVHARIRQLIAKSGDWDFESYGTPLSAANLGLAISVFSRRLLDFALLLGARLTEVEQKSVMAVWRYSGYLMGIPDSILYTDSESAREIHKIAFMCEPPPDADSAEMANALINAIPGVANISNPTEQKKTIALAYRISRALIGNSLADSFNYPKTQVLGTLVSYRIKQRIQHWVKKTSITRSNNFLQLLNISIYDEEGVSYKMPDHVRHSFSSYW